MIVPMKKVSLVVLDTARRDAVKRLRSLGVVHVESLEGSGQALSAFKEASSQTDKAIGILDEIKLPKKQLPSSVPFISVQEGAKTVERIVSLSEKKKALLDSISQDTQELERMVRWGTVSPEDFSELAAHGIFLYPYEIPQDKYALIGDSVETVLVNSNGGTSRFLLLSSAEITQKPEGLPPEAYAVPLPRASTERLERDIAAHMQEVTAIEAELRQHKRYREALVSYKTALAADIEAETLFTGMGHEEDSPNPDTALAWLTGYVPVDSFANFEAAARQYEWAFVATDPADDDPVPTKLHNNRLVSLIYPLTDFLDVTPGYREYDISGWFLLFFCVFFAMIFGDAGYGALIALVGVMLAFKSKQADSVSVLVILLGFCTMVWGTLTCTCFGIEAARLPAWFVNLSAVSPFSPEGIGRNGLKIGADGANVNQKIFCFVLALVQLSIAHVKGIAANRKSLKAFGELGALLELWGMFYVVMSMVVDSVKYPLGITNQTIMLFNGRLALPYLAVGVLLFGFALNFVFSNYEGSIGASVLESCKNIISVLLGIVNVFSDIVSYIRLWAVALAGAAISSTVNAMAGPMLGKLVLVAGGVVLLLFGHGLNLMLNLLSVIVHGVRLNTLEFSTHLGMTWSGIRYRPFRDNGTGTEW